MNQWQGIGRLGSDPEVRFAGSVKIANIRVATDEVWKDKEGATQKRTEWHRVVLFGKNADTAEKFLRKGRLVHIEGRIQNRTFDKEDGTKGYISEIICRNFKMLDSKNAQSKSEAPSPEGLNPEEMPAPDDEVPF
jgi:single-strand DNA-binding protein